MKTPTVELLAGGALCSAGQGLGWGWAGAAALLGEQGLALAMQSGDSVVVSDQEM